MMIEKIKGFFTKRGFYVCSRLGERLGIQTKSIRLSFMYLSFFTFGIGFAIYLVMAFILKIKDLIYTKRSSVFDL